MNSQRAPRIINQAHLCMGGDSLPTELTGKPKWICTPQQLPSIFRPQCPLQDGQNSCPPGVKAEKPKSGTHCRDFPGGPVLKNPPCSSGVQVQSLVREVRFPCARATDATTTIQCLCHARKSRVEQQRTCLLRLRPNNSQINFDAV